MQLAALLSCHYCNSYLLLSVLDVGKINDDDDDDFISPKTVATLCGSNRTHVDVTLCYVMYCIHSIELNFKNFVEP